MRVIVCLMGVFLTNGIEGGGGGGPKAPDERLMLEEPCFAMNWLSCVCAALVILGGGGEGADLPRREVDAETTVELLLLWALARSSLSVTFAMSIGGRRTLNLVARPFKSSSRDSLDADLF